MKFCLTVEKDALQLSLLVQRPELTYTIASGGFLLTNQGIISYIK